MTTYALVRANAIEQVGDLPRLWNDGTRDYDFRNVPQSLPAGVTLASLGWLEVVTTPRPPDTDATTFDYSVELIDGVPTEVWTERSWTDQELADQEVAKAQQAWQHAQALLTPEATDNLNAATLTAQGQTTGDPWRQPTGVQDAYPAGWQVTHNGKSWESLVTANVYEPGVSGWREVGTEWPDWVQPTGAHDAYDTGAKVTHLGAHWVSDVDDNVWEPGVYGWTEVVA